MDQTAAEEDVVGFAGDALGGLDILVNNAGIIHREDSIDMTLDDWRRVLSGTSIPFGCCLRRQASAWFRKDQARSSSCRLCWRRKAACDVPAYASSKHAVVGLTKAFCQ